MIKENVQMILKALPGNVQLVAATKTRTLGEIREAIEAGIKIIGQNYIQEAQGTFDTFGVMVRHHLIGHLQSNKVGSAVKIFDMIETVDSSRIAEKINECCRGSNKVMSVLIEVNSALEENKYGVFPRDVADLIKGISSLGNIKVRGLMTMGPFSLNPEASRPYFSNTKKLFDEIKSMNIDNVAMDHLSMGMSDSYQVAIDEGANMVRIGTAIFGERTGR